MWPGSVLLRSFTKPPWPLLLAVAALGLLLSYISKGHAVLPDFCGAVVGMLPYSRWPDALDAAFALNSSLRVLTDWALMIVAMMPPLLAMPLMHIWRSSLSRNRLGVSAAFVATYWGVWMAMGGILTAFSLTLRIALGEGALAGATMLALLWSATPLHRAALNRGHRVRRISLFGWRAHRDGLTFGVLHGLWCVASCWAWMVVPLVAGVWHIPLMVLAGVVMLTERLSLPGPPRWRWPLVVSIVTRPAFSLLAAGGSGRNHG